MSGVNDFDFLIGDWSVRHRRLKRRLAGDAEWIEFTGPATVRKILDGLGNVDEFRIDLPGDAYTGVTLRLYNPKTRLWSIHWIDSRNATLDPPVVGSFQDGKGLFFGDDTFEGKPIRIRFVWTPLTPATFRWEQAFSADQGTTWETNWTMELTRVDTRMTRPEISSIAPFFIVKDVPAALSFYRDMLDFEIIFQGPPEDIFFGIVRREGAMILMKAVEVEPLPNRERDAGARWDAFVRVPDPDSLAAEFSSRGVVFTAPLEDTHDGLRGFELEDADGYVLFFGRTR